MGRSWNERGTYGNIIKNLIKTQVIKYELEKDRIKATKISQNIGYLVQVQSGLIKDAEASTLEKRIEELERRMKV
ncbi:hypothetical protein [Candidatus Nitrosarchaeum limnium]|uniref:Uncharacterized protein n=1 Tax=Candidatus Nitrosarchaeum limnium BG20 TaxID=859192 RepID=S2E0I0_9ARCH|nr:hypothetical protein [Candidatus Nitrosarchaeum limnium]EPA04433.1 hypothetical protein BG20_I1828 [Candidatus Nitrosarchaeum limnium BG20]